MRRHESLIPLTHDHHHALIQVRRLMAASRGTEEERRVGAQHFLHFFDSDTIRHFREEEEQVFPLVVRAEEARGTLERVMIQHLNIHFLVQRLRDDCDEGHVRSESLLGVASALERHIRFEEKVVFPLIQNIANEPLLESVSLRPRERGSG